MGKPQQTSDANFEQDVLKSETPVLVDFWATWCGPCRMVAPVLEEIANEQGEKIRVAKLDVDANPITAGRFGVRAIPTMILFKNGREADRIVGYHPKPQLMQKLTPHLTMAAPSVAATPTASSTASPKAAPTPPPLADRRRAARRTPGSASPRSTSGARHLGSARGEDA